MTNLEIDRKLAEAMQFPQITPPTKRGKLIVWKTFTSKGVYWHPTTDMGDAWEVAERFGLTDLRKETTLGEDHWFAVFSYESIMEFGKTAPLAVCKAALKVIEGSKTDE